MLIDKIIFKVNAGTATTPTYLIIAMEFSLLNIDFFADYYEKYNIYLRKNTLNKFTKDIINLKF